MQSSTQAAQTATPFPEFLFSPPVDGKDKDHRNPENEVQETVP